MTNPAFVFCDIETTGLDPLLDVIMEVGFVVTDIDLKVIDEKSWSVAEHGWTDALNSASDYVRKMHADSGLTDELLALGSKGSSTNGLSQVSTDIFTWLFSHNVDSNTTPLSGSTIDFDRKFLAEKMPSVNEMFHYRSINVSSLKELCRLWNPNVFAYYQRTLGSAQKKHRVLDDIHASINELEFYCNEFLLVDFEKVIRGQEVIQLP